MGFDDSAHLLHQLTMPAIASSAPAKIILFGEHAVVYGQPAIAIPFTAVKAKCSVFARPDLPSGKVNMNFAISGEMNDLHGDLSQFMDRVLRIVSNFARIDQYPASEIKVTSSIPLGSGLGSSASIAVAMIRAATQFLGLELSNDAVNELAYQSEMLCHGTSSGLDNTVVVYEKPVYFVKNKPLEKVSPQGMRTFIVADTGIPGSTRDEVAKVRSRWESSNIETESLFARIGAIANQARHLLENHPFIPVGNLLTENHELLQELGVSSQELDHLVIEAIKTGAFGAKMTGGGGGGNIVAEVKKESAEEIRAHLLSAGAKRAWITQLGSQERYE